MFFLRSKIFIYTRRVIYGLIARFTFAESKSPVVFCYHSIANNNWRYSINLLNFKRQVELLLNTRKSISTDDVFQHIKENKNIGEKAFLLAFDDGYKDVLKTRQYLKKRNIKPIVFVLSDPKKADATQLNNALGFLTVKDIKSLEKDGWEIGCHSATHQNFGLMNKTEIEKEIIDSKKTLEKSLGRKINYFAYPKGIYNEEILKAVRKAGYKMAFSMDGGFINSKTDLYRIPRVGIDKTHTLLEFSASYTTLVLAIRRAILSIGII